MDSDVLNHSWSYDQPLLGKRLGNRRNDQLFDEIHQEGFEISIAGLVNIIPPWLRFSFLPCNLQNG